MRPNQPACWRASLGVEQRIAMGDPPYTWMPTQAPVYQESFRPELWHGAVPNQGTRRRISCHQQVCSLSAGNRRAPSRITLPFGTSGWCRGAFRTAWRQNNGATHSGIIAVYHTIERIAIDLTTLSRAHAKSFGPTPCPFLCQGRREVRADFARAPIAVSLHSRRSWASFAQRGAAPMPPHTLHA